MLRKRILATSARFGFETLEARRVLTFTFSHELVDLPLGGDVGNVMAVVDLNQDAHLDIVVGSKSGKVHMLLGQEDGSFESGQILETSWVRDVFVADLNGDSRQDVAVYSPSGIWSLTNRGNQNGNWLGFDASQIGSLFNSWDAQSGMLNGDEHLDLVVGDQEQIKLFLGNGDGTFEETQFAPTASLFICPPIYAWETESIIHTHRRLDVGDINNDGFDDIVTAFSGASTFTLEGFLFNGPITKYVNNHDATFVETVLSKTEAHRTLSLFDINRDDNLDLLVGGPSGDYYESVISEGNGDGTFELSKRWNNDPSVIGEFRIENAAGERAHSMNRTSGEPGGLFLEFGDNQITIDLPPWRNGAIPRFVDLDRDGMDEIVGLGGNQVAILRRRVASPLVSPDQIVLPAGDTAGFRVPRFLNDFDRDGYVDQAWLLNQGQSLVLEVRWGTPEGTTPETSKSRYVFPLEEQHFFEHWGIEDINSDGLTDLRFTPFNGPNIHLLSSRDRAFHLEFGEPTRWQLNPSRLTTEGDIDGDGFDDRVTLVDSLLDGLFTVQRGLPDGSFEEQGITYQFRKPSWDYYNRYSEEFVNLADMTGDGILDVVYFDDTNTSFFVFPGISDLEQGDVNRDGEVTAEDLVTLNSFVTQDSQEPHHNLKLDWTGDRRVDARDVQHLVEQVFQTRPGDLNLDGTVDFSDFLVLSNSFGSHDATWLEGDFDGNSKVDFADFLVLSTNFEPIIER